jgi:uncharacterized protein YaaR (DUF327 family)
MAKIPDLLQPLFNPVLQNRAGADAEKARGKKSRGPRFSSILEQARTAASCPEDDWDLPELPDSPEAAVILQDALQSAGNDLKDRPFPEEIRRYKGAARRFLRYVVEKGYVTEQHTGIPRCLRPGYQGAHGRPEAQERKTYTIIQVVDEKLERLAAGILSGQMSQLKVLAGVEEINGILIDLLK